MATTEQDPAFENLLEFIKWNRGFDFTGYKRASLTRRFQHRMQALRIEDFADYQGHLEASPEEFAALFNTILINVTSFFRDPSMWQYVAEEIVPKLVESSDEIGSLRVWCAGCSSGEEPFTIAMLLAEALDDAQFRQRVKIYGTDADEDALTTGRHASYPIASVETVPAGLREKYFDEVDGRCTVRPEIRRSVIFGRHDLNRDPPIPRIDLLTSRNTLMYFEPLAQTKVLANFHFALRDSGYLFLGKSEVLMARTNLFTPVDLKRRVFQRVPGASRREYATRMRTPIVANDLALRPDVRDAALEAAPVAQLVVDESGRLVVANRQARSLLGLAAADVGRSLHELDISYRPVDLRTPLDQVRNERRPETLRGIEWTDGKGDQHVVDVHVSPLAGGDGGSDPVSITFTDVSRSRHLQAAMDIAKQEGETAYEELQSTFEELETTNEELQSTNEELETTNEELQAANEELETMNEEMQAANEELETINEMLNRKTEEAGTANLFLNSILDSLDAGVVVLDHEQIVLAWNNGAEELWGLRTNEARGQHFMNLDIGLPVEHLSRSIRDTTAAGTTAALTVTATNRRGRPVECHVTLTPIPLGLGDDDRGVIMLMEVPRPE
jgi:two-component system CheB/CheR fusion protein